MTQMYRQGDVLLIRRRGSDMALREKLTPVPRDAQGRIVLALGEATGHAHAISTPDAMLYGGDPRLLFLDTPARLDHEEHAAIDLPIGVYEVRLQREFIDGAPRTVAD